MISLGDLGKSWVVTLPEAAPERRRRWPTLLCGVAIYLVHLGLVVYACPYHIFFGGEPLMGLDYQTHYEQTRTVSEAITRWGQQWAYDPNLLAGQPAGLIFDVDNRTHSLFTHLLHRKLGLDQATAFNLFPLVCHLLAPLCLLLAARLLRVSARAQLITFAFAVLLWHFDSAPRWCWWVGMISFASTAFLSPLIVALFHRLLEERRWRFLLPILVLLPLALMTHVWAFATLAVPMIALYLRAWRRGLPATGHLAVAGIVIASIAANLFWLIPVVQHLELLSFSGKVGQANPLYLIADYFDVFINPLHTGSVATRTTFRFAALAGTALTIWRWRKEQDGRTFVALVCMLWLLGLTYFASLLPLLKETEPYRFVVPTVFFAALFAGPFYDRILRRDWIRELAPTARVVLVILLLLVIPRAAQQIIYFIPELVPQPGGPPIAKPNIANPQALQPTPEFFSFKHDGVSEDYRKVAAYLRDECQEEGRVLVEWWVLAEYLHWSTGKPIIGGFPDRRLVHEAANIFRYKLDRRYYGQELTEYLKRYNIRYLVISNPYVAIERRPDILEPKKWIKYHRIYRVKPDSSYVARGEGRVRASLNRIEVEGARPAPGTQAMMLRFHWHKTLRCSPGCSLRQTPLPDNPLGFITVIGEPRLPERFAIENGY